MYSLGTVLRQPVVQMNCRNPASLPDRFSRTSCFNSCVYSVSLKMSTDRLVCASFRPARPDSCENSMTPQGFPMCIASVTPSLSSGCSNISSIFEQQILLQLQLHGGRQSGGQKHAPAGNGKKSQLGSACWQH